MSKSDIVFEKIKMMFQQLMERLNEANQAKIKEMNQVTHTSEPSRRFNIDPEASLIMRNEELNTIPKKESDKFIKSIVEDLVLIPSESEDTFGSDIECVLPLCDDFSPINISEEKTVTFSNPLFNSNDDLTSSNDESLSDEDVLEDIKCKDSYDSNLDESTFLVIPLFDVNENEYFTSGDDVKLLLHQSKDNEWKKILYDAPIDDLMSDDKVFDLGIHDQIFSPTYSSLPFTDRQYLFFIYVIQILLLYFTYPVVSPFLLSSRSEDTIFDPVIYAFHFSHRCGTFISFNVYTNILNESPMEIFPSFCFTPNITMIWGKSS
uniref:Uncharacterized protein n=1 Tax=Tanacetum cinerariifolium TaxID=118510 RepID=A0A6L2MRU5_TANCI|nr:hypothetical protein [Tanacetum cinerariifolium]